MQETANLECGRQFEEEGFREKVRCKVDQLEDSNEFEKKNCVLNLSGTKRMVDFYRECEIPRADRQHRFFQPIDTRVNDKMVEKKRNTH